MTRSTTWADRLHRPDGLPLGRESGPVAKRPLLAVLLGLTMTLWLLPLPAWAATTWVVDGDGQATQASCDADTAADSLTITGAVAIAADGDTIHVCAGTYAELVVVNKALTLLGFQHGKNPATRSGDESVGVDHPGRSGGRGGG